MALINSSKRYISKDKQSIIFKNPYRIRHEGKIWVVYYRRESPVIIQKQCYTLSFCRSHNLLERCQCWWIFELQNEKILHKNQPHNWLSPRIIYNFGKRKLPSKFDKHQRDHLPSGHLYWPYSSSLVEVRMTSLNPANLMNGHHQVWRFFSLELSSTREENKQLAQTAEGHWNEGIKILTCWLEQLQLKQEKND